MRPLGTALAAVVAVAACSPAPGPEPAPAPAPAPLPAVAPGTDGDAFRDVVAASGIDFVHVLADGKLDSLPESVGAGVTCLDFDGDGRMDLFFVAQGWCDCIHTGEPRKGITRHRLYRNLGGGRFEDATDRAGVGFEEFGYAAVAADLDDDGRTDLFLAGEGFRRFLRNRGDGRFEDLTEKAGLAGTTCAVAASVLDANGDGRLDVYVGNYVAFDKEYRLFYKPVVFPGPLAFAAQADQLYLNRGDGTFEDASTAAGFGEIEPGRAMGTSVLDFDVDGRPDLYVANDATACLLLRNEGGGRFREIAVESGVAYGVQGDAAAAMAAMVGDVNGDGRPDLRVTASTYGSMFVSQPKGGFADRILASGLAGPCGQWPSWGGGIFDFDSDGHADFYAANGDLYRNTGRPDLLFRGRGDGTFEDVSKTSGAWFREERPARGACIVDFDDDARLDVVVSHIGERPALLRNQTRGTHGVLLALKARRGTASGHGAKVKVRAGGREQVQFLWPRSGYLGSGDPRLHFGVGAADRVEVLEVVWPDGTRQEFRDLATDRVWTVEQGGAIR